jgi:DNA processing protein
MEAHALTRGEPGYPPRLAELDDSPPILWIAGRWQPRPRAVAVVGARAATARGISTATAIAAAVGGAGVDVISGGALGIDAAAHRGALDAGGATVAVLGTGIDVCYPARHAPLFEEIQRRGAIVTQFPPGLGPRPWAFPTRNRVVAGLADLVVVVEAGPDSGSLITARCARLLGRAVAAVPGSPGADTLLVEGAAPLRTPADALALLDGRAPSPPPLPSDPDAARLYAALDSVPRDVGDLAFRAGLGIGTCAAAVIDLEIGGLAARASGGRYIRLR